MKVAEGSIRARAVDAFDVVSDALPHFLGGVVQCFGAAIDGHVDDAMPVADFGDDVDVGEVGFLIHRRERGDSDDSISKARAFGCDVVELLLHLIRCVCSTGESLENGRIGRKQMAREFRIRNQHRAIRRRHHEHAGVVVGAVVHQDHMAMETRFEPANQFISRRDGMIEISPQNRAGDEDVFPVAKQIATIKLKLAAPGIDARRRRGRCQRPRVRRPRGRAMRRRRFREAGRAGPSNRRVSPDQSQPTDRATRR